MKYEGEEIYFEEAFNMLEEIAEKLQNNESGLEESLKLYEKGIKLCRVCEDELERAKLQIEYFDSEENLGE